MQGRAWDAMQLLCLFLWLVSQHKADTKAAALHLFRFEFHKWSAAGFASTVTFGSAVCLGQSIPGV